MKMFRFGGRDIRLVEFSDLSVDGMVYECWEHLPRSEPLLLFSFIEDAGKVVLKATEPVIDLALIEAVLDMVDFAPEFTHSLDK